MSDAPSKVLAGTSGWAYPTWKPGFYPAGTSAKKFLGFYASQLNSVEVNYTFRTLPTGAMLDGWLAATPSDFRFSFKAPQGITHFKRLRDCAAAVDEFLIALEPVREAGKLGLLFFQLPPNFKADAERLASFLSMPSLAGRQLVFEFRHESWFTDATYQVLAASHAALCVAESDDLATPEVHPAPGLACFRLRRTGGYTPEELKAFATRFRDLAKTREVYAYFRHEDEPTGPLNAASLLQTLGARG
ncbi:Uncharacterized conserved protein YecE, DUF72 family [Granulicella pectinivorans]|uniref:Uncharacterized conserved protein YecE, DUF72 family n=1 Tax=Granulicella pectinivorans TaxID=474950 RepID=A0A1I6LVZ7_9BACT|nr:DUF72 domain-containing protein [Granulicella pectinivorans]SFS07570.1 Uncharacterized conserved protein YecE, DUF72 family [Granulicella pectinivorans]